ncbi:MAG: InlB B-repeat-containing protein [Clostridia bacterium]|nr:InlB B-repeat-containing protein [Clostridia bacterium]
MKKYLKKSLSTFLALLMVFTSLVFVVPDVVPEAEAVNPGTYYTYINYNVTDAISTSDSPNASVKFIVYYKTYTNNGAATTSSSTTVDVTNAFKTTGNGKTLEVSTSGWPYKVELSISGAEEKNGSKDAGDAVHGRIEYVGISATTGQTGGFTYYWDDGYNVKAGADNAGSATGFASYDQGVADCNWPEPVFDSIDWDKNPSGAVYNIDVPYDGKTNQSDPTPNIVTKDQYGVAWACTPSFVLSSDSEEPTATTIDGITLAGSGDSRYLNVTNAAKSYVVTNAAEGTHTVDVFVYAFFGTKYAAECVKYEIKNVIYDVNYENLFSLNAWLANAPVSSFAGNATIDQLNGKLTLENTATAEQTLKSSYQIPVQPGKTYTLEYVRGEAANTDVYVFFNNIDKEETGLFNDEANRLSKAESGLATKDFVIPSGVDYVTIRFDANYNGTSGGNKFTFSNIKFYEKDRRENFVISSDRVPVYGCEEIGELPTPTKTGYTFDGWYTGVDGTGTKVTETTQVVDNVVCYAKWIPVTNYAEFYTYDGQLHAKVSGYYNTKISAVQPTAPASYTNEAGTYIFYRWVNMETGAVLGDELFNSTTEGVTVAKYKAEYKRSGDLTSYTATFLNPADSSYSQTVEGKFNESKVAPTDPVKPAEKINGVDAYAYEFIGWSLSEEGDVVIKKGDAFRILENVTYYAQFERKVAQHTITTQFGTNEGGANAGSLSYTADYASWVSLPNAAEWRDQTSSYIFSHWVDSKGNEYEPSSKETMVQVLGPETYTAVYDAVPVRYHAYFYNGTELCYDQELSFGGSVTVPEIETPKKDRVGNTTYEFDGWYLYNAETDTWGEKLENGKFSITGDDYTFYAKYNEIKWANISFLKDADSDYEVIGEAKEYKWGDTIVAPEGPKKESTAQYDYKFTGWTEFHGGQVGAFYAEGAEIKAPERDEVTFYIATYEETVRKYTVTFYGEDGETVIGAPQTIEYGSRPIAPADPTKESTVRYEYVFDGWSDGARLYDGDEIPEVTGDAEYKAVFSGRDVYYQVHWLTPTAEGIGIYTTVNYTYNRVISMPATAPVFENTETQPGKTWGFAGWYLADQAGNLLDAEGNVINSADYKESGVVFTKGTHITGTLYYIAVFDFIPNPYRINVYGEEGQLLKTYSTTYGSVVYVTNFEKESDANKHYVLAGFATAQGGDVVFDADKITDGETTVLDTTTAITVNGNLDLYVVYEEEAHDWDVNGDGVINDSDWTVDVAPTYKDLGSQHRDCTECSYRQTAEIAKLRDDTSPVGQITIGGNSWTNECEYDADGEPIWNYESTAYVRDDSIISILTTDVGNGIKTIKYTWSDGTTHTYKVENEFDTEVNYNFLIPADFAGKYLNIVVTDYVGKTYKLQTATLQLDKAAPTIQTHIDCLWFGFALNDNHEIDTTTIAVTDADGKPVAYSSVQVEDEEGNLVDVFVVGDPEEETALKAGKYTITVADKAGNAAEQVVYIAGEHVASDWIVDTEAACLTEGTKHKECTACEKVLETGKIPALTHDMNDEEWVAANTEWKVTTEPACEKAGEKTLYCVKCNAELMKAPVDALEHIYDSVVTEPTCDDAGYTTYTCSLCSDEYVADYVDALGHDMQIVEEVEADCEKAGYTVYECANGCGKKETVDGDPALNHPEDQRETITIESECTGSTLTKVVCKLCGEVLSQEGNLDGHDWEETKYPATCTDDAYTIKACKNCDVEIKIVDRLTKLGHAWDAEYTVDKAADCVTAGSQSIHCSRCDVTKDAQIIPALGHNLVLDEESKKEATCNTDGYELWECSRCDYKEEKVIKATGDHVFNIIDEDASKAPDCVTDGLTVYKCGGTDCTATKEVVIPALGHEKGEKLSETKGDCQTRGTVTYACTRCEDTITEEGAFGAHEASTTLVKTIKAANCTDAGDGVFKCKNCDATVIVTGGIAALGHDYVTVETDATCVEDGVITKTCSRCGDVQVSEGDEATGEHTWNTEYTIITEADCDTNGSKAIYCSVCGELKPDSTVIIPALGHKESDWIVDKKANCTEDGSKHIECTVCGVTLKTEAIPSKGGHTQGALVKTNEPATCSKVGEGVYKCTVCGETYIDVIAIDADNHSYSEWNKVDANCTDEGYKVRTCTNKDANGKVCGAEERRTVPALGHNYQLVKEEIVEQNGNFVTKFTYKCSRCGGTYTDTTPTTAYVVTVVDTFNGATSTIILKDGAQLRKSDLPTIEIPEDVEQTTYVLSWTDASGKALKLPMDITGNTTIYANIKAVTKTYTVEFVNNSGKIISSKEYTYGATVVAPEDQVLLNSTFLGWSDGTNIYAADAIPAVTGNVTYSAEFKANPGIKTYYVTFKSETGSKTIFTQTVTEGGTATVPEAAPEKAHNSVYHYVFAGWYTATEGGVAYDFNATVNANVTVYARFTAVKHSANASSVSTPADCANPASTAYTCNVCGYEWVTYTSAATGHTYKETNRTTTADGKVMVTYVCSVCGDTWTKTVTQGMADSNAIIVTVTDSNGNPVEGASVSIYLGDLQVTVAVTNSKGKAYFAKDVVTDGSYRVNVSKQGYDDLSGTLVVKDGKGSVKLNSFSKTVCRCVCHADTFFGKIKRWFTNLLRSIFKSYTCCDCGNCGYIY